MKYIVIEDKLYKLSNKVYKEFKKKIAPGSFNLLDWSDCLHYAIENSLSSKELNGVYNF